MPFTHAKRSLLLLPLLLLLAAVPTHTHAQINALGSTMKSLQVTDFLGIPRVTALPVHGKPGGLLYKYGGADSGLYVRSQSGTYWNKVGGGIGASYSAGNGIKIAGDTIRWADTIYQATELNLQNDLAIRRLESGPVLRWGNPALYLYRKYLDNYNPYQWGSTIVFEGGEPSAPLYDAFDENYPFPFSGYKLPYGNNDGSGSKEPFAGTITFLQSTDSMDTGFWYEFELDSLAANTDYEISELQDLSASADFRFLNGLANADSTHFVAISDSTVAYKIEFVGYGSGTYRALCVKNNSSNTQYNVRFKVFDSYYYPYFGTEGYFENDTQPEDGTIYGLGVAENTGKVVTYEIESAGETENFVTADLVAQLGNRMHSMNGFALGIINSSSTTIASVANTEVSLSDSFRISSPNLTAPSASAGDDRYGTLVRDQNTGALVLSKSMPGEILNNSFTRFKGGTGWTRNYYGAGNPPTLPTSEYVEAPYSMSYRVGNTDLYMQIDYGRLRNFKVPNNNNTISGIDFGNENLRLIGKTIRVMADNSSPYSTFNSVVTMTNDDMVMLSDSVSGNVKMIKQDRFRRIRAGTPSSSSDSAGSNGDLWYDDNYLYYKTASGWRRVLAGSW